ncbi:MAG: ComEC/Rec2 family competence protein [Fimbriimonas sp.]
MRRALAHRPLLALAVVLAMALAWRVNPGALVLALPFFAFRRTWPFALAGLLLGLFLAPAPAPQLDGRELVQGEAHVVSVPRVKYANLEFEASAKGRHWSVALPGRPEITLGDRLQITAVALPLPDGRDDYARLQGIEGRLKVVRWSTLERGSWIARMADGWRRSFSSFCHQYMREDVAVLTEALGMNLDGTLDDATRNRLRATGTVHIVSASGLHVFVLAGFLTWVLSFLPLDRRHQLAMLLGLLTLYAFATGLNPPVLRSIFMAMVGLYAYTLRRDQDPLSALALAAFLYLLWRPRGIFDIGFQLSFLTVGALCIFGPTAEDRPTKMPDYLGRLVADAVRLSWIAFVASAPLVAYHFGTLSVLALPANLAVGLAVPVVVVGGLLAHGLSFVLLALGVGMIKGVEWFGAWIVAVLGALGDLPWAQIHVPALPAPLVALAYGVLILFWRVRIVRP